MLGVLGGALLFLRLMTKHVAAYDNTNLFVTSFLDSGSARAAVMAALRACDAWSRAGDDAGALTAFGVVGHSCLGSTRAASR